MQGVHRQISGQLLRSGTSVGANAEEAQGAFGRRDFAYRNSVVLREARESRFWLRLIGAKKLAEPGAIAPLLAEANELIGIYSAIVKKAKAAEPTKWQPTNETQTAKKGSRRVVASHMSKYYPDPC